MLRKKILLVRFLIFLFSALTLNSIAGTIYWVENSGNWNDPRHWSHTSGGQGGAGVPNSTDDVVFDINSFSNPYEQVTITSNATCHNLQWMDNAERAVLGGNALSSLNIYGSANIEGILDYQYAGSIHFKSSQTGNSINLSVGKLGNVYFEGSGSWKLSTMLYASNLYLNSGELDANGFEIACTNLNITGNSNKVLNTSSSILYIGQVFNQLNSGNFQFNSPNCKLFYQNHQIAGFSAITHTTHKALSADSSHFIMVSPTCYQFDSGTICNGKITITTIYSSDSGPYSFSWNGLPLNGSDSLINQCGGNPQFYQIYDSADGSLSAPIKFTILSPGQLSVAYTKRQPRCNLACDGWLYYCLSGETPPYTFSWSNGPAGTTPGCPARLYDSSLCKGNYTIHIKDSRGCHNTLTPITITDPKLVTVTTTFTPPSCSNSCNATATAHPTGGHGVVYTYLWSAGGQTTQTATGLCEGSTYTVIAYDDSLCSGSATVTITGPPVVGVSLNSPTNVTCFGACNGQVTATGTGGVGGFTYLWNTIPVQTTATATSLCAGTYKVIATDAHGCKDSTNVTITQPNPLVVPISTTNNPLLCGGNCNASASASVSGGTAPYTYNWNIGNTNASISSLCAGNYKVIVTDNNGCNIADSVSITQPTPVNVSITSFADPTCNGSCNGSISTTTSGGSGPYTYNWAPVGQSTPNAIGLCNGTYTLTVTDKNSCVNNSTVVTLVQPLTISASVSVDEVTCNLSCDGKAFASVSGGTTPYTYKWNTGPNTTTDSVTGLCAAANDSVKIVDANLCNTTIYYPVTQPSPLSTTISANNSSCKSCNGSATVSVSGGTAPYKYSWNTLPVQTTAGATNLCPGSYTVTVTDSDFCTTTQKVTIVPTVTITLTSSASGLSCNGSCDGTATANASGGSLPYSFAWSSTPAQTTSTATGLCAGTYTIIVNDVAGCTNTDSVTFINPPPLAGITSQTNVSCNGTCVGTASIVASGGTLPYTYLWSSGQTTSNVSAMCQGTYTIKLTDAKLCNITYTVTISQAPPLAANPTVGDPVCLASNGTITLAPTGGIGHYTYQWSPGTATGKDTSGIGAGSYTVTITDSLGCTQAFIIPVNNTSGPTLFSTPKKTTCWNTCDGYDSVYVLPASTPSYTFLWSNGFTTSSISNLCPGIYVCSVTDGAGCVTNQADTIKRPNKLQPNATSQNVTCNGANDGSINFAPSGGTGTYNYLWNPPVSVTSSASNLAPLTYTITISDAKGCDSVINITISQPAILSITMSSTDVLCNGACNGTATGTVSGGTLPYTYAWSNGGVVSKIVNLCNSATPYTLNVLDGNGCAANGNVTITEPTVLSGIISGTNVSCSLGGDGTAMINVSGGTSPYSYLWTGGYTTSAIGPISKGKYIVTVTDKNSCSITDSITITEPAPINIVMASANATCNGLCNGTASATVTGGTGSYSYAWTGGMTTSAVSGLCASTYTLNVTDANSCPASSQVTISQPTPLLANVTNTDTKCPSSCDGTAASTALGGVSPYTYLWTGGMTSSAVSNLCAGNDTVFVMDANLCIDTGIVTITNPQPITTSVATAASSCNTCNGSINITPSGGTPTYTYSWSGGLPAGNSQINVCAGIYTYTVTDANLCTASFSTILNNSSGPTGVTVTKSNDSCFGLCDGFISTVPTGGTAPYTYTFNGGAPQGSDTGINLCAGSYTIIVTDFIGCKLTDTSSLTQPTQLVNTGVTTNATCIGICNGTATLTTSGGTPPYKYSWSSGQTQSALINLCPGVYTVTVTDADLCSLVQTYTVGQNVIITSVITSTNILCHDSCTGTASEKATGGAIPYTYSWVNGAVTSNISALCAGKYGITVTDFNGCEALDTATITQPSATLVTFKNGLISCNGSCDGSIAANATGGTPGYTYLWSSAQTTDSISNLCFGTYSLTVTDKNGCNFDTSTTLANPPVLTDNNIVTNATCNTTNDGSITVTAAGGVPPYSYNWSTGASTQTITNLLPGTYILAITDSTNCTLTDKVTVVADTTVIAKPGNDTAICATFSATLNGSASINASTYQWFALPGRIFVAATSKVVVSPAVSTQYMLVVTDGICRDSSIVNVTINALPVVSAGTIQTIFVSSTATLGGSPTGPVGSSYVWMPGSGMTDSTVANPVVTPSVTTIYTVTVTSPFGCTATDTVTIIVLPKFIPPGGFTPNGDGINDYWDLGVEKFPNVTVEVYNRWGERLYHSVGYKIPWNGEYMNLPLPVGTYYYVINLNDPRFPNAYTGPVSIMR